MKPTYHPSNLLFPLWQFLTQPLCTPKKPILNPIRFWKQYNIQHLEHCRTYDPVQLLERCWAKEVKIKNPHHHDFQK
ncbi:MAG: hypothetical protein WCA35_00935 [Kovacikia sp.]